MNAFSAILVNMNEQKHAINRNYKDSVFVDFFSNDETAKANFLSLYNALHGTHLDSSTLLQPLRLEHVLYMSFANDVSYLIDNKLIVLAEHQSTINPNMPIRCLEYVVRLYERLLDAQERYARRLVKIPTPEFYVFYNGQDEYPNETILHLSDAFMTKPTYVPLELEVKVLKGVVMISLSDKMLYKSGDYNVLPAAQDVLGKVAKVINDYDKYSVLIEGNTDNVPLNSSNLPRDNWDLSALRATAIAKILQTKFGVNPSRITAGGRSEYNPKSTNMSVSGRAENRRTEIIIMPKLEEFMQLMDVAPVKK